MLTAGLRARPSAAASRRMTAAEPLVGGHDVDAYTPLAAKPVGWLIDLLSKRQSLRHPPFLSSSWGGGRSVVFRA
jgi:hypothetical protein